MFLELSLFSISGAQEAFFIREKGLRAVTSERNIWGKGSGCYLIAEIGLNHNGQLGAAMELIEVAADAGVAAVKFQKREVENLAVKSVLDSVDCRFPSLGTTYRELREKHEFSLDQFFSLKARAAELGLDFFVTPFDPASVVFLELLEVDRYKIASHGVTNHPLLKRVAKTRKPVLLSTGMASIEEVDSAIEILRTASEDLAILHCVSSYPTASHEARLDLISVLRERYNLPVGYSGHEIGIMPTLMAVGLGAQIVERHITLDKGSEGFDHHLSLEPRDLKELVLRIREVESMSGNGGKYVSEQEVLTRRKYQVSMVSRGALQPGHVLSEEDFTFKNPGTGLAPAQAGDLIGKTVRHFIEDDTVLQREMFG